MTGGSLQATARRRAATLFRSSWPVLAALVALLPFIRGFSTTNVFFVRDLGLFFWPRHLWLWQTVREGDWPLWDPYAAAGQSAVADPLNHFFLLPATIVRVLAPPVLGFNFWVAAPAAILAIGTCVWLRRRLCAPAAAVGGAIAALAGPIASAGDFSEPLMDHRVDSLDPLVRGSFPRSAGREAVRRTRARRGTAGGCRRAPHLRRDVRRGPRVHGAGAAVRHLGRSPPPPGSSRRRARRGRAARRRTTRATLRRGESLGARRPGPTRPTGRSIRWRSSRPSSRTCSVTSTTPISKNCRG